jgi:CelD/BcsL family acetyltransferase involved in cellulose biosynthesis
MVTADVPPILRQGSPWRLLRLPFGDIPRIDWDRLHAVTPAATPFSAWTFHRAWWDAFAASAEEHYLVLDSSAGAMPSARGSGGWAISAIVPLMMRESGASPTNAPPGLGPGPAASFGRDGGRSLRTLYFAASYHADYATLLAARSDLPAVAAGLARHLAEQLAAGSCDTVDLRRLAETDPALDLLAAAWRELGPHHEAMVRLEPEDVCPVVDLATDWHTQLGRLDKKTRHEVRRKLRRAERQGPVELRYLPLDGESADRFILLHQARWGSAGLFAAGEDGDRNRLFLRRLAELEAAEGPEARFHLGEVVVGGHTVYALAGFASGGTCYFYNAGMDPDARDLSPGIVGTTTYLRDRIDRGDRRFDFLRGDEAYKYEWGANDVRLTRLVIGPVTDS